MDIRGLKPDTDNHYLSLFSFLEYMLRVAFFS